MTGTERKVFQKYYPPDFDPRKLKKEKGKKRNLQFVQRVMSPFNMQCNTCREYIYKGKKFNMRRETAEGEHYLGMKIFRFYFRCPNCLAEISFKTDIENVDYSMEQGATRLFEAFKHYQEKNRMKEAKEEAEKNDAMKMLEKRTQMSRVEMEAIAKLDDLQQLSNRQQATNALDYFADVDKQQNLSEAEIIKLQEERDKRLVAELMNMKRPRIPINGANGDVEDDETISIESTRPSTSFSSTSLYKAMIKKPTISSMSSTSSLVRITKKPLASSSAITSNSANPPPPHQQLSALSGLAADYGSSSDDDNKL